MVSSKPLKGQQIYDEKLWCSPSLVCSTFSFRVWLLFFNQSSFSCRICRDFIWLQKGKGNVSIVYQVKAHQFIIMLGHAGQSIPRTASMRGAPNFQENWTIQDRKQWLPILLKTLAWTLTLDPSGMQWRCGLKTSFSTVLENFLIIQIGIFSNNFCFLDGYFEELISLSNLPTIIQKCGIWKELGRQACDFQLLGRHEFCGCVWPSIFHISVFQIAYFSFLS